MHCTTTALLVSKIIIIITRFSCLEARCSKDCQYAVYPLLNSPDPSKTQSTVGTVLRNFISPTASRGLSGFLKYGRLLACQNQQAREDACRECMLHAFLRNVPIAALRNNLCTLEHLGQHTQSDLPIAQIGKVPVPHCSLRFLGGGKAHNRSKVWGG